MTAPDDLPHRQTSGGIVVERDDRDDAAVEALIAGWMRERDPQRLEALWAEIGRAHV